MKTILIHHRSSHHAQNSGYSRLVDYMPDAKVLSGERQMPYRLAKFIGGYNNQGAGLYDSSSVQKEIQLYKMLKQNKKPTVVHYLNAERDVRYAVKYLKRKQVNYCATFHKPPTLLKQTITNVSYLKALDGAICVGSNQVGFIKDWLGLEQVYYIPHGVDTTFFTPRINRKENTWHILFVGQHLRDFKTFNDCIPKILEQLPQARASVVLRPEYVSKIKFHSRVQVFSGINDVELRNFYRNAGVLFLPLLDATACNSLLEAMACGLPIITSHVGGTVEYLKHTENVMCENNKPDSFIEACVTLLKDEDQLERLGENSRKKALDYSWDKIALQVEHFYRNLI